MASRCLVVHQHPQSLSALHPLEPSASEAQHARRAGSLAAGADGYALEPFAVGGGSGGGGTA
eukprot:CAMPEP_0174731996 /NCGR_PEP_ID=MMETSP1094-20130205/58582_1 /TAXON_ID=156173 /ORGANISM="Chrysochromulina brevifilum, Strain UTEX LB 985" /LENGTH=61 /DNA_ID=CAMNT_0015934449 /DNA_START=111 /DNA_END=296 /DNA_ORIENTATION=+